MADGRLLIVSNRLPVAARVRDNAWRIVPAAGGLATGLQPWHEQSRGVWIGWPGEVSRLAAPERARLDHDLRERAIVPVYLSRDHVERYYHGFSNRVLWPLFHYLIDRVPVDAAGWDAYTQVNEAFADVVAREYRDGDAIWVHDYQLMLLPMLLRRRLPDARIGFFLHMPFPSSEVFRILPWRQQILNGLLGADLVGFHTFAYMRHFLASLLHVLGVEAEVDRVRSGDREVRVGAFPMGIDAQRFAELTADPAVIEEAATIRRNAGGRRIVLGVDRLDYTKGIPRRLQAIERLFQRHRARQDDVQYIQVAVPSRQEVDSYQRFRRQVEEMVGHINGANSSLGSMPVHYLHRSVSARQLAALYLAADVMLVTPLRDGMNLVAKEFVASRTNDDGVLILSEFAGAASELFGAMVVNPYDVDEVADAIDRALAMPVADQRERMRSLRSRVFKHDARAWGTAFVGSLTKVQPGPPKPVEHAEAALTAAIAEARAGGGLRLLLDYDGTLVPLAPTPEEATPDPELMSLMRALAARPDLDVEVVSGRSRDWLEACFGDLPIGLWAEHGFWHRVTPGAEWRPAAVIQPQWADRLLPILEQFTASTPGSRLERKRATIAWHFRGAQQEFGAYQAHELRMLLGNALINQPLEVLEGKKVIEIRWLGVSKAVVANRQQSAHGHWTTVAFGDDQTDDDLFRALPPPSLTVAVGEVLGGARYCVSGYRAVRRILHWLVTGATIAASAAGVCALELASAWA